MTPEQQAAFREAADRFDRVSEKFAAVLERVVDQLVALHKTVDAMQQRLDAGELRVVDDDGRPVAMLRRAADGAGELVLVAPGGNERVFRP